MLEQSRIPDVTPEPLRRSLSTIVGGGVVSCIGCGSVIALANAVVGGGYRCQTCSTRAPRRRMANGTAAHVIAPHPPRARRAATKPGTELIFIGGTVLALGAIVMSLLFWWPGLAAILLGGVTIGVGVARRNA